MDEKHRQYCIRLGNPYMREEQYRAQFKTPQMDGVWEQNKNIQEESWIKNNRKFTN